MLLEGIGVFALATGLLSMLYRLRFVPIIERNISVLAALLFLYLPAGLLWRRRIELDHYGLRLAPLGRSLRLWLAAMAVIFPLFALGYWVFLVKICPALPRWLWTCGPVLNPALRLPPDLLWTVLGQIFVVALPEEFFFRGYLQGRLEEVLPPPAALLLSALLFALGHVLVSFDLATLAVFFPGLIFGLLRHMTGSVLAGTLLHASSNLLMDILHRSLG
ncbi:MAG: CPBP family intramembrane glutamic endopeptidase [Myxococcales bacterium]|nr:CPBP family intramembrane metalloprotease [Myxococcota bacterium]MDW8280421.1 CPBP family intramembrane glutamic endopeptidase [Myxococcales bacterium]